jgi:hypothetical protein
MTKCCSQEDTTDGKAVLIKIITILETWDG